MVVATILVLMERRADIEGVRAIAVLAVLLFHAGVTGARGGYIGVDVFFVVSGFLITSLLLNEKESAGQISLKDFYARRARRILPVSSLVAVITVIASWVWLEPLRLRALAHDVIAVATFSSNFVFANRGADYLQSTLPASPLQHYWSLAVEEQFYLVWPALIAVVCLGVTGNSRFSLRVRIATLSILVSGISFGLCMWLMNTSQPWAFYSPHTRAFELSIGALFAALPIVKGRSEKIVASLAAWAGLITIFLCIYLFLETTRFPGPSALVPVFATAFVLRGGNVTKWSPQAVLQFSPLQWLGSRSYSAYLWHWPILIIAVPAMGRELTLNESLGCVVLALVLSEVSYRIIENPIRRNKKLIGARALVLAVSLLAIVGGTGVLAQNNPPKMSVGVDATTPNLASVPSTVLNATSTTSPVEPPAPSLPDLAVPISPIVDAMLATGLPGNITPSLQGALSDMPIIYNNGCHAGFSVVKPKNCVFGDLASTTVIGLYGDSHAAQWFPAFEKVAIKRHWKLITYTKRGCPPAEISVFSSVLGKVYNECAPWRKNAIAKMKEDGVQVVFVAHFDRLLSASTRKPMWQKEWREGLQGSLDVIRGEGIVPVLMQDTPYPGQDVPTCLSRNYTNVHRCTQGFTTAYREDMTQMVKDFDVANENVLWVQSWFCATNGCPTVVGNIMIYRDDNHMSVTYASFIATLLDADIAPFVERYALHDNS